MKQSKTFFYILPIILILISIIPNELASGATSTHNYANTTSTGWSGGVLWGEKFTGLPGGQTLQSLGLNITTVGGSHVRVKIYDTNGTTASTTSSNNFNGGPEAYGTGTTYANEFKNLVSGQTISSVSLNLTTGTGTARVKIYQDNGVLPTFATPKQGPDNSIPNGGLHPHTTIGSSNIYLQKFTGLTPSGTITDVQWFPFATGTSEIRIKAYKDDNGKGYTTSTNNYQGTTTSFGTGNVWAEKFTVPVGETLNSIGINQTSVASGFNGHIRYKIYNDSSGSPGTLLNESCGSQSLVGPLPNPETCGGIGLVIPSTPLWIAFEVDSNEVPILAASTGLASGSAVTVAHAYGTGPASFGVATSQTTAPYIQISYSKTISGFPNTILYDGTAITSTGINHFGVNITIPTDGNIWLGYEANTGHTIPDVYYENNVTSGLGVTLAHSYGTGPSPATTSSNSTTEPFLKINYVQSQQSGGPGTLLGESSATSISGGVFAVSVAATIPSSGNIWVGTEFSATQTYKDKTSLTSGVIPAISHSYGTGPSPFGYPGILGNNSASSSPSLITAYSTSMPWLKVTFSTPAGSEEPGNLLGESGSVTVNSTGINSFPFTSTTKIPTNGKLFGVFEVDTPSMGQSLGYNLPSGSATVASHVYGTGPASFGTPQDQTFAPWMRITYDTSSISAIPTSGHVGDTVTMSGSHMGISNNITFKFDGISVVTTPATVTTDPSGSFSGVTFVVPADSNGVKTINATNGITISATTTYTLGTLLSINPTSGPVGQNITSSGSGYSNNSVLTFKFNGNTIATSPVTVTTDHLGQFNSTTFLVPSLPFGPYTIQVSDGVNSATQTFTINPSITINPTSGGLSTTITTSGNGFTNASSIIIKFNGNTVTTSPATITTDHLGQFNSTTFVEPLNILGTYTVSGTDGLGNIGSTNFVVSSSKSFPSNCGIGGCVVSVNYNFHRSTDFSKLYLTVYEQSIPFHIECNYKNGTFTGGNKWINESSVNVYNHTVNVPQHDIAQVGCYGSGVILSFISPGNSTIPQSASLVFNNSFGAIIGIPAGMFVVVLIGSMGNQRTGPIYLIASLAVAGILATVGFFVLETGWWVMSLIFGMLGLLVGRKMF